MFHVRGALNYPRLGPIHLTMMAVLRRSLLKKDPASLTEEDRQLLATYGKVVDFKDKESIRPIVDYVRQLRTKT